MEVVAEGMRAQSLRADSERPIPAPIRAALAAAAPRSQPGTQQPPTPSADVTVEAAGPGPAPTAAAPARINQPLRHTVRVKRSILLGAIRWAVLAAGMVIVTAAITAAPCSENCIGTRAQTLLLVWEWLLTARVVIGALMRFMAHAAIDVRATTEQQPTIVYVLLRIEYLLMMSSILMLTIAYMFVYGSTAACSGTHLSRYATALVVLAYIGFLSPVLLGVAFRLGLACRCSCLVLLWQRFSLFDLAEPEEQAQVPVTRAQIQTAAPETKYSQGMFDEGNRACNICMEPYSNGQTLRCLPCDRRHHFCRECIDTWLQTNSTCPICRASLLPGAVAAAAAAAAAAGTADAAPVPAAATEGAIPASTGDAPVAVAVGGPLLGTTVVALPAAGAAAASATATAEPGRSALVAIVVADSAASAAVGIGASASSASMAPASSSEEPRTLALPITPAPAAHASGTGMGHSRFASDSPAASTVNPLGTASALASPVSVAGGAAAADESRQAQAAADRDAQPALAIMQPRSLSLQPIFAGSVDTGSGGLASEIAAAQAASRCGPRVDSDAEQLPGAIQSSGSTPTSVAGGSPTP